MSSVRYYFFGILHAVVLVLWYFSGFYVPWPWVLLSVILFYIQNIFVGHCIITLAQFGNTKDTFYYHYLTRLGFKVNKKHLNFMLDHVIPWVILASALIYQRALF